MTPELSLDAVDRICRICSVYGLELHPRDLLDHDLISLLLKLSEDMDKRAQATEAVAEIRAEIESPDAQEIAKQKAKQDQKDFHDLATYSAT